MLIPGTRGALLHLAEHELGWIEDKPARGPGRDDAFNLPKLILTRTLWDASVENTGFLVSLAPSGTGIGLLSGGEFEPRNDCIKRIIISLRGNTNGGYGYGTGPSEVDARASLEYLKAP